MSQKLFFLPFIAIIPNLGICQSTFSHLFWNSPYTIAGTSLFIDNNYIYINGEGLSFPDGVYTLGNFIIKTDLNGNQLISKNLIGDTLERFEESLTASLFNLNDSILIATGYYHKKDTLFITDDFQHLAILYFYNKTCDTIKTIKYHGLGNSSVASLYIDTTDSTLVITGGTWDTADTYLKAYIAKIDLLGNVLWEYMLGDGINGELGRTIDKLPLGGYLYGGMYYYSPIMHDGTVYKLDSQGQPYFSKKIGTPNDDSSLRLSVANNGKSFYVYQRCDTLINEGDYPYVTYIGKTDTNANFIWRTFLNDAYYKYIYSMRVFDDGSIVAVGGRNIPDDSGVNGYIVKLDSNGNILWERNYSPLTDHYHYFYDLRQMPDKGYVISGSGVIDLEVEGFQTTCWLVRLDSMGCLIPGCGDVAIVEQIPAEEGPLKIYPNPMHDLATVEFTVPETGIAANDMLFHVYDLSGRLVDAYSNQWVVEPGETIRFTIKRHQLAAGIYTAVIILNDIRSDAINLIVD